MTREPDGRVHEELRRRAAASGTSPSDIARRELERLEHRPFVSELVDQVAERVHEPLNFAEAR